MTPSCGRQLLSSRASSRVGCGIRWPPYLVARRIPSGAPRKRARAGRPAGLPPHGRELAYWPLRETTPGGGSMAAEMETPSEPYADRRDAGRRLAERLSALAAEKPVVVALP